MTDAKAYIRLTLTAQIRNLSDQREVNMAEMESIVRDMENSGDRIVEAREVIDANQRLIADLIENSINFGNKRIDNLANNNEEITGLIEGLKVELAKLSPEPAKAKEAPARRVRTQYGELTPEQMKVIRKKYAVLLELRGASLYEYLEFLKSKGRTETNKAISLSLGKNPNWLSCAALLARKAGYDA